MSPRQVRLPLQIGSSSLSNLALGAGLLLPGSLAPVWWAGLTMAAGLLGYLIGFFLPFVLVALAIGALRNARRRRASDLVIERGGVRIEGGRLHGLSFDAKELRAESWRLRNRGRVSSLEIDLPGAHEMVLAESTDARETHAFEDVVETVRATFASTLPQDREVVSPDLIHCAHCGGEASPDAQEFVRCRYCEKLVKMPAQLRSKLLHAAQRKHEIGRAQALLEKLLRQPAATSTNRLLSLVGAAMLLVWPASIAISIGLLYAGKFSQGWAMLLLALPLPLLFGLYLAAGWRLVDRQTLQLVTVELGADPPRREGAPYHCRSCGGPLPERGNELLVDCPFCNVENVLGFDLRHALGRAVRQVKSVEQALGDRRARRLAMAGPAAIGALMALAAAVGLVLTASASFDPERLTLCTRTVTADEAGDSTYSPYTCDTSLPYGDRVLGSDLQAALAGTAASGDWEWAVVRKIGEDTNPDDPGGYADELVPKGDYAALVVRRRGDPCLYIDGARSTDEVRTQPKDAALAADGGMR